ncbi:MAG: tRNA (adenosine(37)-N6)-threonylcarbamoyltransferase complex dimerization subunit type 1 TsaB, partial [Planctomycetales bacterium]|nr:tRNA (adenosine(37)-N6)-threonylcarbamoyltransferase complex dimerization subunit type 1 TsaB [Planctomycetales bacterium]
MRTLALETSERVGSLAAFDGDQLVASFELAADQRTAAVIGSAVGDLLHRASWRPADVQLVAVTSGPGSFTGLRIGVTFAKTFAFAVQAEVLACDTLDVIAAGCPESQRVLWTATNAQRQQVFA